MSRRRAMTLIELLVSLALLGMLAALAALMWGQLRGWGDDTDRAADALRPHRVHLMLAQQWNTRAPAGDQELLGRPRGSTTGLSFVTLRSIRFPGWPVVEATYTIEPATPERAGRLLYEEKRYGPQMETVPIAAGEEPLVLLENLSEAEIRFRARVTSEHRGETVVEEAWISSVGAESEDDSIELLYAELHAAVKGEDIRWVGIVEHSR